MRRVRSACLLVFGLPKEAIEKAASLENVRTIRYDNGPSRRENLAASFLKAKYGIIAFMDIDLSTDLAYFPSLVDSLNNGYDIAIGSRLQPGAVVIERSIKREFISRMYNSLVMIAFQTRFSDAQCGFKAVTKKVVKQLIPHIIDDEWFMDSELLIVGEKAGYRIFEEPVVWRDNPGSTVRVLPTAMGDLKGLLRLFVHRPWRILTNDYRR